MLVSNNARLHSVTFICRRIDCMKAVVGFKRRHAVTTSGVSGQVTWSKIERFLAKRM